MKRWCVFLVSVTVLTNVWDGGVSPSPSQSTESIALAHQTEQVKVFKPIKRGIPGRREGGATR